MYGNTEKVNAQSSCYINIIMLLYKIKIIRNASLNMDNITIKQCYSIGVTKEEKKKAHKTKSHKKRKKKNVKQKNGE